MCHYDDLSSLPNQKCKVASCVNIVNEIYIHKEQDIQGTNFHP